MGWSLAHIRRHPIKSHGREALDRVTLEAGRTMPWDRTWAVAHEAAKADGSQWAPCANFTIGAKAPGLMAISARLDPDRGVVHLSHPDLPDLSLDPDTEGARLVEWSRPLVPQERAASARVLRVPGRGMTDTDYPSVSVGNLATHRAVEQKMGRPLSFERWRLNLWLEGLAPWEEFDLIGKVLRIGEAELRVVERVVRCKATTANPETGRRDADTLGVLESWGHRDMGVYTEVVTGGTVGCGDTVEVI